MLWLRSSFYWITKVQYLIIIFYLLFFCQWKSCSQFSFVTRQMEDMTWIWSMIWICISRYLWSRNLIMLILNCVCIHIWNDLSSLSRIWTQWINQTLSNVHNKIHSKSKSIERIYGKTQNAKRKIVILCKIAINQYQTFLKCLNEIILFVLCACTQNIYITLESIY